MHELLFLYVRKKILSLETTQTLRFRVPFLASTHLSFKRAYRSIVNSSKHVRRAFNSKLSRVRNFIVIPYTLQEKLFEHIH